MAATALLLAGCAIADSHAPLPEFMRKTSEPAPPQTPPNVAQLVRDHLDAVFVATSNPREVEASPPLHEPNGPGWTACVRAELTSATGRPLGPQTYRITIEGDVITDRRRVEDSDNCASQSYEPV